MSKLREQSIAEVTRPLLKAARKVGLEGANQVNLSVTDTGHVAVLTRPLTDSDRESLSDGLLIGLVLSQQSGNVTVMQLHVKGPRFAELTPSLTDMDGIAIPRDQLKDYLAPTATPDAEDVSGAEGAVLALILLVVVGLLLGIGVGAGPVVTLGELKDAIETLSEDGFGGNSEVIDLDGEGGEVRPS